jgi:hypothetical protein
MYHNGSADLGTTFALSRDVAHKLFVGHHPVLGFAPGPSCIEAHDMHGQLIATSMRRNGSANCTSENLP